MGLVTTIVLEFSKVKGNNWAVWGQ